MPPTGIPRSWAPIPCAASSTTRSVGSAAASASWRIQQSQAMCCTTMASGRPTRRTVAATVARVGSSVSASHIHQGWTQASLHDGGHGTTEREARSEHDSPGRQMQRAQCDLDGRCARGDRDHLTGTEVTGQLALERQGLRAHRDPPRTQHAQRRLLSFRHSLHPGERHRAGRAAHWPGPSAPRPAGWTAPLAGSVTLAAHRARHQRRIRGTPMTPTIGQPEDSARSCSAVMRDTRATGPGQHDDADVRRLGHLLHLRQWVDVQRRVVGG